MVFFVLPFITDVPYLDDRASTHDAEGNSKVEGKAEPEYHEIAPFFDVQNDSVVGHNLLTPQVVYKKIAHPPRESSSFQSLFHVLLISRPPPIVA